MRFLVVISGGYELRIMGLDYGDKRIGVAISDSLGLTAQAKGVIKRRDLNTDLDCLKEYISEYDIEEIIVGLPINMDGSSGFRADRTTEFVNFLKKRLELSIKLWDERLSTVEAERLLLEADIGRAERKKIIDQVAAAIILQSYLDAINYQNRKGEG
jgi:putative holliday junction resolvase